MGWTSPITFTAGAVLTAAQLNTNLRDNLNYFKGSATANVATSETTTSTSYTDLTTVGPAVTITTDVQARVFIYAAISNSGTNQSGMGYAVSGSTTVAASDPYSITCPAGGDLTNLTGAFLVTGLTAGSNTFTAKYRVTGGTGTYVNRRIDVQPA